MPLDHTGKILANLHIPTTFCPPPNSSRLNFEQGKQNVLGACMPPYHMHKMYLNASFILCHMGIIWNVVVHHHLRKHMAAYIAVMTSGEFCKALQFAGMAACSTSLCNNYFCLLRFERPRFGEAEACCVSEKVAADLSNHCRSLHHKQSVWGHHGVKLPCSCTQLATCQVSMMLKQAQ